MKRGGNPARVLAIDPTSRGFGFIVLEGPATVVDWGVKSGRAASITREQQLLARIGDLLAQYSPTVLVLEDVQAPSSRRCGRIRLLIGAMGNLALWRGIVVKHIPPAQVRRVFAAFGARTKDETAAVIKAQLPELVTRLPRRRKPWTGEDYQMAIFDAAALALAYFCGGRHR